MDKSQATPPPQKMVEELVKAGWTKKTIAVWRDPKGGLWLGPTQAWKALKHIPLDAYGPRKQV